jgi:hypothetical protein
MDILLLAKRLRDRFMIQINKTENIERQNSEQMRERIQELKCDLIENKEIAQRMIDGINESVELNPEKRRKLEEQIRILEENGAYHQTQIAQLEGEIFRQDERIVKLTENVRGFQIQLAATDNNLEETRNKLADTKNVLTVTRNDLVGTQDELRETKTYLEAIRNELTETNNVLTKTQSDNELTKKELKKMESVLRTGQIAFDFEKDLATYIYPHDKKFGSCKIFTNMKKWLEEKKDTQQGSEANEKWNALQVEFSWSNEHERVFFKLLESRKEFAHPVLNRNAVQSQIPDDYTDEENKCIKDIVGMVERVSILMQQ